MARPTKLTSALIAQICQHLEEGMYFDSACALCDVPERTAYDWLAQGEGSHPTLPQTPITIEFSQSVKKATAKAEKRMIDVLRVAVAPTKKNSDTVKGEWTAAAWWLERRMPRKWGRNLDVTTKGDALPAVKFIWTDDDDNSGHESD